MGRGGVGAKANSKPTIRGKKLSRGNLIQKRWRQTNNLIIMHTGQNNNARCMMLLFVVFCL